MCSVCTVAVGAGLGLSRFLGVSDLISGLWIGAFILSFSFAFERWLVKKVSFPYLREVNIIAWYVLTLLPLYYAGVIGHPQNRVFGLDKLLVGITVGTGVFLLGIFADKQERKIKGKQLFDFQKVVFPVSALIITSIITYILI